VKDFCRCLGGVDFKFAASTVEIEDGLGGFFVGGYALGEDFIGGVVEAVFLKGALAHAGVEFVAIWAGDVEDLKDVDVFFHEFCLTNVARDTVEDEEIDVGLEFVGVYFGIDLGFPKANGDFIGDELTGAGVFEKFLADFGAGVEGAECVSHREVVEAGNRAEGKALSTFAGARGAEENEGLEFAVVMHFEKIEVWKMNDEILARRLPLLWRRLLLG